MESKENNFYLKIDWEQESDREVFNFAKKIKFSEMRTLYFENLKEQKILEILNYLRTDLPNKLNTFAFDANTEEGKYGSSKDYIEGITNAASITSNEVWFRNYSFSRFRFEAIVKASKDSKKVVFCNCRLNLNSKLNFSGPTYSTSHFSFRFVGNQPVNDWKSHPERLERIIQAISKCSLKDSLKTIDLEGCDVQMEAINEMLRKYELFDKIKIAEEAGWSLV